MLLHTPQGRVRADLCCTSAPASTCVRLAVLFAESLVLGTATDGPFPLVELESSPPLVFRSIYLIYLDLQPSHLLLAKTCHPGQPCTRQVQTAP